MGNTKKSEHAIRTTVCHDNGANEVTEKAKGGGTVRAQAQSQPAASSAADGRTVRKRVLTALAAASNAQKTPSRPRYCRTCKKPMAGHPKQCGKGPSNAQRLQLLEDAAEEREQQSMAEEAAFLGLSEDDLMDTDAQPLGIPNADVAEPQPKAPATPRPAPPPPLNSAEQGHSVQLTPRTPAAPPASSTSPAPPPLVQVTASPPLRAEPTGPSKTALTVPPAGTADVSMSVDGADTAPPAGGSGPPHQDGRSKSTAKTDKQRKASVDSDNEQDVGTEALDGGLKSTPAGDVPLPMKRSPKSKDPYPPRTASKKATEMFQSVARQADFMSTRVPGWAFCMFVPMERKGEMRSWSSPQ
ncbi:hypothetical protein AURDEDRAFT_132045, partial [Auricularia subglabra TFB-10046 SS5]